MRRRLPAVVAVLLAVLAGGSTQAAAKTYLVSTTADPEEKNSGCAEPCSLRQAIEDADASGEPENIVQVPPGEYALTLTLGSLKIAPKPGSMERIVGLASHASEVIIKGKGGANGSSAIVIATPGAVPEVSIDMVEITGGHSATLGGGIEVGNATVALTDVAVKGNAATEAGGGIDDAGKLTIVDSVIAGNKAEGTTGGGIDVKRTGTLTLLNSTIAGNTATGEGGGIYNAGAVSMSSATIAGNEAAKAGGGIASLPSKPIVLADTILALNTPTDCATEISDPLGHDLEDDGTCKLGEPGDKASTKAGLAQQEPAPKPTPMLTDNGGPTETIALQSTSPAVGAGSQEACPTTDQRGVTRPAKLCDIGAFQLSQEPKPPTPPPNPSTTQPPSQSPPPPPPPTPVRAHTGNVAPASGTVLVELPGTHTFVALTSLRSVPFGTVIDATHGRVIVTTAGPHGGTQTGEFFGGEFVLTQKRDGEVVAALTGGDFAACPTASERAHRASLVGRRASAAGAGRHPVRKLWANAHGSFSTKGNYAAGAVQGTEWLTEDFCNGTLIRVTRDKVLVTNLVRHRHLLVKAGHSQFAKAP